MSYVLDAFERFLHVGEMGKKTLTSRSIKKISMVPVFFLKNSMAAPSISFAEFRRASAGLSTA
jgi:hypothetical protein